ncbi:MAG: hypothetical protein ABR587_11900 [Candidatus Binatia bacterium]
MKVLVAFVLAAITVAMAAGYGVTTRPILADNQLYFFMTERCASGTPPHVSQMEVKTQLPTLIGGAAIALGRLGGADDILSGRAASVTAAFAAALFGWLLALSVTRNAGASPVAATAAGLVGAAAMFSIHGLFAEASSGFQPKVFMVAFLLAAHWLCAERRALAAGVAGACAFLCWQPAGLVLASCGLALLLDRRTSWTSLARFVAGALVVFVAYEAWFAWNGALQEQLHQEWRLAFGAPHKDKVFRDSLWFVLTESQAFQSRPHGLPVVFVAATALLWLGLLFSARRGFAALRERPGAVSFWTAAHIATAFTLYDHQAHPDMLLVQPYFAVACGIAAGWIFAFLDRFRAGATPIVLLAAVFVCLGLLDAKNDVVRSWRGRTGLEAQRAMGRLVSLYYDHRGSVWALGSVHLLALNHRDNWVSVGNVGHETSQLDMKTFRPLRDGQMPEIILSGRGLRPGHNSWLQAEYIDITPAPLAGARVRVFSRRSSDQPGFARSTAPKAARGPQSTKPPAAGKQPAKPPTMSQRPTPQRSQP